MIFRCTSIWSVATSGSGRVRIYQERRCEERRWHTGWHHATWTWYPPDGSAGEYRTVEWSGEPDHPFERETVVYPTLGMFAAATPEEPTLNGAPEGTKAVGEYLSHHEQDVALDGQTGTDATREQAETDESPDEPALASSPLMKAHLALICYGRHQPYCDAAAVTGCTCGFNKVLRETCPAPEEQHHG